PPQNNRLRCPHCANTGSCTSTRSIEGTKCATVTCSSHSTCASRLLSCCSPGATSTACAPANHAQNTSQIPASKLKDASTSSRAPGSNGWASWSQHTQLLIPRCVFMAPLGCPVEPEV